MCLIVTSQTGFGALSRELVTRAWLANPHGFGLMYAQGGKLHLWRGMPTLDGILASTYAVPAGVPAAIHFRKATCGDVSVTNAHPHWVVPGKIALMHNGTLAQPPRGSCKESDTVAFVAEVLAPMLTQDPALLEQPAFAPWLARTVGPTNRLVLLRADGRCLTINSRAGFHQGPFWFSRDLALAAP